jgi:endoglucanase
VAALKHVRAVFDRVGATNVRWVWCANVIRPNSSLLSDDWPGDEYVDWVAADGYNFGAYRCMGWQSFSSIFGQTYDELTRLTAKPLMIGETASNEDESTGVGCTVRPGDKPGWITQGFLTDLPKLFPRFRAVVWFDINKETDWRVNSSAASLAAFEQVARDPYFQGGPPL